MVSSKKSKFSFFFDKNWSLSSFDLSQLFPVLLFPPLPVLTAWHQNTLLFDQTVFLPLPISRTAQFLRILQQPALRRRQHRMVLMEQEND